MGINSHSHYYDNYSCSYSVLLQAIRDKYSCAKAGPGFEVQFEDDSIRLEIPDDGVSLQNGWEIKPLIPPVVSSNMCTLLKAMTKYFNAVTLIKSD